VALQQERERERRGKERAAERKNCLRFGAVDRHTCAGTCACSLRYRAGCKATSDDWSAAVMAVTMKQSSSDEDDYND